MTDSTSRFRFAVPSELASEICKASGCDESSLPPQVRYLVDYVSDAEIQARGLLIEDDYIDRHYLEEYVAYYASKLRAPSPRCARIHIFQLPVVDDTLADWLARAAAGASSRDTLQRDLSAQYVGFIVVRPHAAAPIGRTLLRTFTGAADRCYAPAQTWHDVHILGLELSLQALPFQQQDRAVGACATTALWTALSRVLRNDGARSVTPFEVTQAATRYITYQRAIPAERGLTEDQINAAIRAFGYEPHHLSSQPTKLLRLCLKCYLLSGIPVLLDVANDDISLRHAIVLCGFRPTEQGDSAATDIALKWSNGTELVSRNFTKVYAHDDRLGPYARMGLELRHEQLRLKYLGDGGGDFDEELIIHTAIVPLYRKLRLTAEDLIQIACELLPNVADLAATTGSDSHRLTTECFFSLGGKYLSEVVMQELDTDRRVRFVTHARLSRYVGVVRFYLDRRWFLDVVVDTTDIYRHAPHLGAILALLPRQREHLEGLELICEVLRLSALLA